MPSKSPAQQNLMHIVYRMQQGEIPKSGKAGEIANQIKPSDLKHFLMQEYGFCEFDETVKKRIFSVLKEFKKKNLNEEENPEAPNVIASSKTFEGDFDQTLKMYLGFELTPKENQAIQNFNEAKPVLHDKFKVQYSKSDDFTNNTTFFIKKLRQPDGKFVYFAFVKVRGGSAEPADKSEETNYKIKLIKSIPITDQEGSNILTNFIQAVYHQQA